MYVKGQHVPVTRAGIETGEAHVRRDREGRIILDAKSERIDVSRLRERDSYGVTVNGQTHEFARNEMMRLTIAGADNVFIDSSVDVPVRIDAPGAARGGQGADTQASDRFAFGPNRAVVGGWDRIGLLDPGADDGRFAAAPATGSLRGALTSRGAWGSIDRCFAGHWSLDATAALLSGVRRI